MKVLAIASESISAGQLRDAVGSEDVEVMVVAPALHKSALRFWVSDADEAIARAEDIKHESVEQLNREDGVSATGDTGESDITEAVRDALRTFAADRIVLFAHPPDEGRYRESVPAEGLAAEFGIPVERFELAPSSTESA